MKVLVTGASGTLGLFVIRALMERHDVVLMSRHTPGPAFSAFPWVQGDLTVFDDCRQAADQGIPFDVTFQSNMVGVYHLMHAAVETGVGRVVMAGSNCALGHGYRISQTPFPF